MYRMAAVAAHNSRRRMSVDTPPNKMAAAVHMVRTPAETGARSFPVGLDIRLVFPAQEVEPPAHPQDTLGDNPAAAAGKAGKAGYNEPRPVALQAHCKHCNAGLPKAKGFRILGNSWFRSLCIHAQHQRISIESSISAFACLIITRRESLVNIPLVVASWLM